MNKNSVVISVKGVQVVEDERDVIELTVAGTLTENEDGSYTLEYTEYDSDSKEYKTVVSVSDDGFVSMTKYGEFTTEMLFEKNKRHNCHYVTPYGEIMIGVYTKNTKASLSLYGGRINLEYTIDFNTGFVSKNTMTITVDNGQKVGED